MAQPSDTGHVRAADPTIHSRRGLLAAATSALVAGAAIATAAHGAPLASPADAGGDAELIRLCDRLVAIQAEEARIFATIEDEDAQDKALEPTTQEYRAIQARLYDLGNPTTPEEVYGRPPARLWRPHPRMRTVRFSAGPMA
jgi:zona occludens toxin (predicted ATPase)